MKRFLSVISLIFIVASLAACSQPVGSANIPTAAGTEAQNLPLETQAASATATNEPKLFVPEDIFGSEFNPFYSAGFPDNFDVYSAAFDIGVEKLGGKPHFVLSMTAEGMTDESITFLAKLAGIEDAQTVNQYIADYKKNNFCEFEGAGNKVFTIRSTNPNDDRYAYVEGSHIDITVNLTDAEAPKFVQLIRDNYNVNALTAAAGYFDITPGFEECDFAVNLHKNQTAISMRYSVTDAAAVEASMAGNIKYDWYDNQAGKMGYTYYGFINIGYQFDDYGNIYVTESTSDVKSALSAFVEADVSLTKLSFGFDEKNICGVYEQHEPYYMNVAIHKPEWGEWNEEWNIEYLDQVNGYTLRITYFIAEDKYNISIEKGGETTGYDYLPAENRYTGEYPDMDTVTRMFNDAFGTQGEDFYDKPLDQFVKLVQDRFGMSIDELYALPIH